MTGNSVAAIGLGSNLESNPELQTGSQTGLRVRDRAANLHYAIDRLETLGRVLAVSKFYDTAPVGYLDQPRFVNAAALLETSCGPLDLLDRLLEVERALGRDRLRSVPKGPRVLDLDLLLYGTVVMETAKLTLPHPALRERQFVLEPLAEIAPEMVDPVTGFTIAQLLADLVE